MAKTIFRQVFIKNIKIMYYKMFSFVLQLMQVLAFFSVQARGPASSRYAEQLASECNSYWQAGRQMCEQISLTGHPCTNRLVAMIYESRILA